MEQHELAIIIPYFGKFNNYFPVFLKSAAANPNVDFLLFTDDQTAYHYPNNVRVTYTTLRETARRFQAKFDFPISLERPYKLCDFRPCYGHMYEKELHGYRFWGGCDTDIIFGNLSHFITPEDLERFDKIGVLGHLYFYRNTPEVNRLYRTPLNGKPRYRDVLSCIKGFGFDEEFHDSINNIFLQENRPMKMELHEANIVSLSNFMPVRRYDPVKRTYWDDSEANAKHQVFIWDKGTLTRYDLRTGEREEFSYIHLMSRPMKAPSLADTLAADAFKIIPNAFETLEPDWKNLLILGGWNPLLSF